MCLAVPGKIIEIDETTPIRMGKVDFGGVLREVCLEAVPEAVLGDYVIIHAGFALNTLSEQEAMDSLEAFKELDEIENELRSGDLGSG
jgi:hydrogenase expression/formation protein HypC